MSIAPPTLAFCERVASRRILARGMDHPLAGRGSSGACLRRALPFLIGSVLLVRAAAGASGSDIRSVRSLTGPPAISATKIVPIVLDVAGLGGSRYTTELTLANRGTTPTSVQLDYTPASSLGATGGGSATLNLASGRQLTIPDTIAYLRSQGLAIPTGSNQGGTLRVVFSGLSSADAAWVSARTTTPSGSGRAGLAYRGVDAGEALTGSSYLYGLRSSSTDRTNLALVNVSTSSAITLRVTLISGTAGDNRTFALSPDTTLAAGQWIQIGRVLDLAGFTNGYARIDLVSGPGPYIAYAVFNDNTTNDGSYVAAEADLLPAETQLLPVLVESAAFQSELVLTNPLSVSQTARLTYVESLSPAGGTGGSVTLSLAPGEQQILPGAIDFLRQKGISLGPKGSATFAGALSVAFENGGSASTGFVGARTAAPADGGSGEYGLFYPGLGPGFAASTEAWVYGLQQNTSNHSNVAVANLGDAGAAISLRIDVYDGDTGRMAGSVSPAALAPGGWTQINAVLASFGVASGYVHVVKLTGADRFLAYGVVNDGGAPGQGTSDGSYVAGQVVPDPVALTWIPGSSVKVEQILGDCDWTDLAFGSPGTCHEPTASQTLTRYNLLGTDIGYSFEDNGKMIFLFGDTVGANVNYKAGDSFAWSTSTDPEAGLLLNFYTSSNGALLFVHPPGVAMGGDDTPNSGISLPDGVYMICNTGSDTSLAQPQQNDSSVLALFDETSRAFTTGRTLSPPGGHFAYASPHASGTDVWIFGAGPYRASDVYLQVVPASSFASGAGTQYFAGLVNGQPTWTNSESGAVPVVQDNPLGGPRWPNDRPSVGDLSVVYSSDLDLWLMTYDGGRQTPATGGVYFAYSREPWGPWSSPQLVFNAFRDGGAGVFIHNPNHNPPGPAGPTINPTNNPPATTPGGVYAPLLIERFTTVEGDLLKIYYTMSTWNPYTVVRMRSDFRIAHTP